MPDDLLRFVSGPTPYAQGWLWLGVALLVLLIAWYAGVLLVTLPARRLRRTPVLRDVYARLLRYRCTRTIRAVNDGYRGGELTAAQAGAQLSAALRGFLQQATGARTPFMQIDEIADSDVAAAAPLLAAFNEAQFNATAEVDITRAGAATEELVRTWR